MLPEKIAWCRNKQKAAYSSRRNQNGCEQGDCWCVMMPCCRGWWHKHEETCTEWLIKAKWDWAPTVTIIWVGLGNGIQHPERILRDKQKAQSHQKGRVFETESHQHLNYSKGTGTVLTWKTKIYPYNTWL